MELYNRPNSPFIWCRWTVNGKQQRCSTKTSNMKEAKAFLNKKLAEGKELNKATINKLLDGLVEDYKINHRKSLGTLLNVLDLHLRPYFGKIKADTLTKAQVMKYLATMTENGYANATLNRHMSFLRKSFEIAEMRFPYKERLKEDNVRQGFLTDEEFQKLMFHASDKIKPILNLAYWTGSRVSEMLFITWDQIDLERKEIVLPVGSTKNDEGRIIPLPDYLVNMFRDMKRTDKRVFPMGRTTQYTHTKEAARKAGIPEFTTHDFRRCAVRNFVRTGIPDSIAQKITGHKDRGVFQRYNIVTTEDIHEAMKKRASTATTAEKNASESTIEGVFKFED